MTEWAARRFWTEAVVHPAGADGFAVHLDARPLRTPAKAPLILPTAAAAEAVAAEWQAQGERIDPAAMPVSRAANAAIDKVAGMRAEVVAALAAYAETDLLCYRAPGPDALVRRQAAAWDPLLDWAAGRFRGARLTVASGVMFVAQPPPAVAALTSAVADRDIYALTALDELVALSGSLVIGLAALEDSADAAALWQASRIDEMWQAEQWGRDEEAEAAAGAREASFSAALRFHRLTRKPAV